MRLLRGWRPALRIARREALRARGRSILVLVMIGLPVLAIVTVDTLVRTADVSTVEGLNRELGASDALVTYGGSPFPADQSPDLSIQLQDQSGVEVPVPTTATIHQVLGSDARVLERVEGQVELRTDIGISRPTAVGLDLNDPMTAGLFELREGRLPRGNDEVAVTGRLEDRGFTVGSSLTLDDGTRRQVVARVESTLYGGLGMVVGTPVAVGLDADDDERYVSWLVSRPGDVHWASVRALNDAGLWALSRSVVENPPPASEVTVDQPVSRGFDSATLAILGLVVAMALMEVVLLAGPAFAVGSRRQQRSLALMAATGAEAAHLRRVVLAGGVVLGGAAAALGAVAGVGVAWLALPIVQTFDDSRFGPFELSLRDTVVVAACGLLSAVLAALAPAMLAARQDVVAVLAGRRGDTTVRYRSPALGLVLLSAGVAGAAYGARTGGGGEVYIVGAAIVSVLGMLLLVPLVLRTLGRLAARLPLAARFAVRDAARHRTRTAPAVAAVAATVAGVVALGIGGMSDEAETRATYSPSAPLGTGVVSACCEIEAVQWGAYEAAVDTQLPSARTTVLRGNDSSRSDYYRVELADDELSRPLSESYGSTLGSEFLIGSAALDHLRLGVDDRQRANAALGQGDMVVLDSRPRPDGLVVLRAEQFDPQTGESVSSRASEHRAVFVSVPGPSLPARALLPEEMALDVGMTIARVGLVVDQSPIDPTDEENVTEALNALDENTYFSVERGYQSDGEALIILLVLGAAGAVLVLGGTLTATFLALSDARPDFATMGAVGAAPRTRRLVAAAYAGTIGLVGAVLGAAVGFVPGIAITYPLTSTSWMSGSPTDATGADLPSHFLDIPWLLIIGLVIVLPLVTAAVVGLTSRSRLPMVSRVA